MDAKGDLKLSIRPHLQASRVLDGRVTLALELPYQEGQTQPAFTSKMIQVGLPIYLETELWPINFNKTSTKRRSIFPETFIVFTVRACFPNVPQFCHTETLFPASIFVSKVQIMLPLHDRYFYRESEHASSCKNFASTSKRALI